LLEIFLVLLTLGSFLAVAYAPWVPMLQLGAGLAALGMLVGVPAGLLYHVLLRARLSEHGRLEPRWWLRPVAQHALLDEAALRRIRPAFFVGGAGFLVTLLGCLVVVLGIVASFVMPHP